MKKIFIVKIILVSFLLIFTIKSYSQDDISSEFNYLDGMCKKHTRSPDSLLFYSKKLLDFSQKRNLENGKKIASRYLGKAYSRLRKFEKSNNSYYNSLTIAKRSGDDRTRFQIYNDLSLNHRATKFYDSAIFYLRKLTVHFRDPKDKRFLNMSYMNLGTNFYLKSELDSAQFYFVKANEGFKESNNFRFLSDNLMMLGEIHFQKNEYKEAIKITDSSQKISKSLNIQRNYARNYNLLARIYDKLDNQKESEKYLELAFENRPKNIDNKNLGNINESYEKSTYKLNRNVNQKLVKDKRFYKSNLFVILFISCIMLLVIYYLYKRSRKIQEEVTQLQNELNKLSNDKVKESKELLCLKGKAIIDLNKLQFIKSVGHYLEFYIESKEKPEVDRNTMSSILEELPSNFFVRIHRSYIVNIRYIKIINSTKIMLDNGLWINLSRTYKEQLKEKLHIN